MLKNQVDLAFTQKQIDPREKNLRAVYSSCRHMEHPFEQPIDGILDLHTFQPSEVKDLLPEYLTACRERGILEVRIIHGKGTGALRRTVRAILERLSYVTAIKSAGEDAGGWGATIVELQRL